MHVTRGYHALALDFSLAIADPELVAPLEWLLDDFSEPAACRRYEVVTDAEEPGRIVLRGDGGSEASGADPAVFAQSLVQWINRTATDPAYALMAHAGGVEREGLACVLPADPESGKTTLTAGLVRAGFRYLTDEAVAFDWESGEVEPFPKPLSIDAGAQFLFPELRARLRILGEDGSQWQVPPRALRDDAVGGRCRAAYVVFPKYVADATTELEPMTRAEGLVELAKNTFRFREQPRQSLDRLAAVVREVTCARLVVGDLDDACALIEELMNGAQS